MDETIDRILSRLETWIRYVAPGFVLLGVAWLLKPDMVARVYCELQRFPWIPPVLVSLIGVAIYAVHQNVIVRFLFWLVVLIQIYWKADEYPTALRRQPTPVVMRTIETERWLRRSGNQNIRMIQSTLDSWASLMNFLYCSSYSLLALPLVIEDNSCWKVPLLFTGFSLFIVAVWSDWRITLREAWMMCKYPQTETES